MERYYLPLCWAGKKKKKKTLLSSKPRTNQLRTFLSNLLLSFFLLFLSLVMEADCVCAYQHRIEPKTKKGSTFIWTHKSESSLLLLFWKWRWKFWTSIAWAAKARFFFSFFFFFNSYYKLLFIFSSKRVLSSILKS